MRSVLERINRGNKMEESSSKGKLGFGDLCRYFRSDLRSLCEDIEDDTANDVSWPVLVIYILMHGP